MIINFVGWLLLRHTLGSYSQEHVAHLSHLSSLAFSSLILTRNPYTLQWHYSTLNWWDLWRRWPHGVWWVTAWFSPSQERLSAVREGERGRAQRCNRATSWQLSKPHRWGGVWALTEHVVLLLYALISLPTIQEPITAAGTNITFMVLYWHASIYCQPFT